MGREHDVLGSDGAPLRARRGSRHLRDEGVLVHVDRRHQPVEQLEGVELRLALHPQRPFVRDRHRRARQDMMRDAQLLVGGELALQALRRILGVHVGGLLLEIAGEGVAQLPQPRHGGLVRLVVQPRVLDAVFPHQPVVHEVVLRGHLRRGVLRDARPDAPLFRHRARAPGPAQQVGAQHARHAAADDQHVDGYVSVERFRDAVGPRGALRP